MPLLLLLLFMRLPRLPLLSPLLPASPSPAAFSTRNGRERWCSLRLDDSKQACTAVSLSVLCVQHNAVLAVPHSQERGLLRSMLVAVQCYYMAKN
jgi:hypothetical protein